MPEADATEFASLPERLGKVEAELERKGQIIEALQKRLFGSQSERLNPDQLELLIGEELLGAEAETDCTKCSPEGERSESKPEPPPEAGGETRAPEEGGERRKRSRRTKADLFPRNLVVVIDKVLIPEEVEASPGDWVEIGEVSGYRSGSVLYTYFMRIAFRVQRSSSCRSNGFLINPPPPAAILR